MEHRIQCYAADDDIPLMRCWYNTEQSAGAYRADTEKALTFLSSFSWRSAVILFSATNNFQYERGCNLKAEFKTLIVYLNWTSSVSSTADLNPQITPTNWSHVC